LISLDHPVEVGDILNQTIQQDLFTVIDKLPAAFVDLLFIDPPYNLSKTFNSNQFQKKTDDNYEAWLDSWLNPMLRILKPTASVYICGDWVSSSAIYRVMSQYLKVRNRITWEREKGRGAKSNWKNCSEDIWFATVSDQYYFNPDAVKLKKKVIAPYKVDGQPKDWQEEKQGNYRLTHPSNLWSDITVPFWSMPENTDHPTQKPEKLLAKIILASSQEGDVIFDPFLGVGTTSVVAKKLNRNYAGVEIDPDYACLAEKRLKIAEEDQTIQGYADGVFWERNSLPRQRKDTDSI
jgi:site-specific DNA-methyltransferase (adenine-specific)